MFSTAVHSPQIGRTTYSLREVKPIFAEYHESFSLQPSLLLITVAPFLHVSQDRIERLEYVVSRIVLGAAARLFRGKDGFDVRHGELYALIPERIWFQYACRCSSEQ